MGMTAEKIVSEALGLPLSRAFVAEKLIESLDASPGEEFSPIWREEIRKHYDMEVAQEALQDRLEKEVHPFPRAA